MSLAKIQSIPYGKEVIKIKNISLAFGGVKALTNVSFEVKKGEVFAIIGPNGAGKSSMLNVINGFINLLRVKLILLEKIEGKWYQNSLQKVALQGHFKTLLFSRG